MPFSSFFSADQQQHSSGRPTFQPKIQNALQKPITRVSKTKPMFQVKSIVRRKTAMRDKNGATSAEQRPMIEMREKRRGRRPMAEATSARDSVMNCHERVRRRFGRRFSRIVDVLLWAAVSVVVLPFC